MTPLIVIPARQMSKGRPCKNREAWPALQACLADLGWPVVVVTDDPWVFEQRQSGQCTIWLPMGPEHTVAAAVQFAARSADEICLVLQPSSPTHSRVGYVRVAAKHLMAYQGASSVISVVPWAGEPPSKACTLNPDGTLHIPASPEPRQLQPEHYRRDGTVYAVRRQYAEQGDLYGPRPIPLLIDPRDSVTLD